MLDSLRTNAKSTFIAAIFAVIIIVFVLEFGQGSQGYRMASGDSWAARVNGALVTASEFDQAYSNRFRQMSQMRGGKYTLENAKQDNLKQETLKSLVDQELLAQAGTQLGIHVSDDELAETIAKNKSFWQDGKQFDFDYYKRLVENGYGMSVPRFEEAYRKDLLRQKALDALLAGAPVTDDQVKAYWTSQQETAAVAWVKFTAFMFRDKGEVTEAEAEAWAKEHGKEVEEQYEKDKGSRWTQPAGVKVRAITVSLPNGAPSDQEKAARARIDAALEEVKGGKEFAAVAKEKSDDSVTKLQGGDLGFISKGGSAYGRTLEEEALKLEPGQLSPVFKDRTGFHFLKAEEKRPERVQPLDEVKKQVAQDLLRGNKAKELARKAAEEALAQVKAGKEIKDLFQAAAPTQPGQLDFSSFTTPKAQETTDFHPQGGFVPNIGQAPKLSEAIFATTAPGATPAAPIEDGDTWYVFKVLRRDRARPEKLDDAAKKSAREALEAQKQRDLYDGWLARARKAASISENARMLSYAQPGPGDSANAQQ